MRRAQFRLGPTCTEAARVPARGQVIALAAIGASALVALALDARLTLATAHWGVVAMIVLTAAGKVSLSFAAPRVSEPAPPPKSLPYYTILAPLYREAGILPQLIDALEAIDYPPDRLEAFLILEFDDEETRRAAAELDLPPFVQVFLNDRGGPRTKPNALNAALPYARGEYLVIYDAEDRPDPLQLREAAGRFAWETDLVCLQAPLRISNRQDGFLPAQFCLDYAAQFDALIPGLAHLGVPFPLGGTSNHFRISALRGAGSWDAFNVTEDADLGFRLAAQGGRLGVLTRPTWEDAPTSLRAWLPQRTRWLKGFIQTWLVHIQQVERLGVKGFISLQATIGAAIVGAAIHGPCMLALAVILLVDLVTQRFNIAFAFDLAILVVGWSGAIAAKFKGVSVGGMRFRIVDAVGCLGYWPLLSIAFVCAIDELVRRPFQWNKTDHTPAGGARPAAPRPSDQSPMAA